MRILLLIALLMGALTAYAQVDLTRRITLDVKEVYLDKLFEILEANHGIVIAFGIDNIPSTLKITLSARNKSIYEILQMICTQEGLSYQVIDGAIVFKYARPIHSQKTISVSDTTNFSLASTRDLSSVSPAERASTAIDSLIPNRTDSLRNSDHTTPNGTEFLHLEPIRKPIQLDPVPVPSLFSPVRKRSQIGFYGAGIFFSYAVDHNRFHFVEPNVTFQKYAADWNHSFTLGGYIILSSKLYISLGAGYATKDFVLNYNYRILDPDDPFPIPDQTRVEIRYLEVSLTIGYGILTRKKYSLCIAAGFYPSYLVEKSERTAYLNSGEPSTTYFVNANRSTIYSGTLGLIAHYSISNACGVFIEPGYLYFIGAVNKKAMQSNSSLYRIKTGIRFSLFHKK